jgi:hypothetical protein
MCGVSLRQPRDIFEDLIAPPLHATASVLPARKTVTLVLCELPVGESASHAALWLACKVATLRMPVAAPLVQPCGACHV